MEYFVFKLNLEPKILKVYDYETYSEHVIRVIIPNALKEVYPNFEELDDFKIKFYHLIDIKEIKESIEYKKLLELNKIMIEMYEKVVDEYEADKGISYSPKYLKQRDKLSRSINKIISKYPILKGALELKGNIYSVPAFYKVQMSVTYINRVKKIEQYIKKLSNSELQIEFIYDKKKEYIYIVKESSTNEKAINQINLIEETINSYSSDTNIGNVSINPIYINVKFEGMYSEVTVEIVYPNGDSARDRSKAIEEANAASEERKFKASKKEKIDASKLNEYFKEYGEKGYIKKVTSQGKNIIRSLIKTVKF